MRRVLSGAVFLALVCAWTVPGRTAEVVEFTDGRFLKVHAHIDEGYYVRLVVDRDGWIIIPANKIDEIRDDVRVVYRNEAAADPASELSARDGAERGPDRGRAG